MGKGKFLNKPCECGSGKKYKKCCLNKSEEVLTGANLPEAGPPEHNGPTEAE
jgi:uncharacterized protein YecA (UPF0149 family)